MVSHTKIIQSLWPISYKSRQNVIAVLIVRCVLLGSVLLFFLMFCVNAKISKRKQIFKLRYDDDDIKTKIHVLHENYFILLFVFPKPVVVPSDIWRMHSRALFRLHDDVVLMLCNELAKCHVNKQRHLRNQQSTKMYPNINKQDVWMLHLWAR